MIRDAKNIARQAAFGPMRWCAPISLLKEFFS
jgi:hypothetical protein